MPGDSKVSCLPDVARTCCTLRVHNICADCGWHASHDNHAICQVGVKVAAPQTQRNAVTDCWDGRQTETLPTHNTRAATATKRHELLSAPSPRQL